MAGMKTALRLAMIVTAVLGSAVNVVAARPNVVLIMTDDQGYGDFSCHGNPFLKTPVMDRLEKESIRLTDFHVAPVCTTTRGQLLTGLDALRNGASSPHGQFLLLKRGLQTMAEVFRLNGYRTAMYGKWHLGANFTDFRPHERGFEDAVYFLRGGVQSHPNPWNSDLFDDSYYHNGKLEFFPGYATDLWFDLGTRFVKEQADQEAPFFLYLPLNAPHAPLLVPESYRRPYQDLDKVTATFFGMIANVDERLGRFLKFLHDNELDDNTILIFLTDNGTAYGENVWNAGMRGMKSSLYEGGHRVPCFIRWPGGQLREPADVPALTHVQDLLPTLIDLCELKADPRVRYDGVSLEPLLRGREQDELRERMLVVQAEHEKGEGTVMWNRLRLVHENELYDLATDPGQRKNLVHERPDVAEQMRKRYATWWSGVKVQLHPEPYRITANEETMLTAYDWWGGPRVYNWPHLRRGDRSNGHYSIQIDEPGIYRIALRRWPRESGYGICEAVPRFVAADAFMAFDDPIEPFPPGVALDIVEARVLVGNDEQSIVVRPDDAEVTMEFSLAGGETKLQTRFKTADGVESGAYYVYIQKKK